MDGEVRGTNCFASHGISKLDLPIAIRSLHPHGLIVDGLSRPFGWFATPVAKPANSHLVVTNDTAPQIP